MMRRPPVLPRVVAFARSFLSPGALQDGRVQVQAEALFALRQPLPLPRPQRLEEFVDQLLAKPPEQVANRIVGGKSLDPHQRPRAPDHPAAAPYAQSAAPPSPPRSGTL